MVHQHRNNAISKLDRYISQVCHDMSTRTIPCMKEKASSIGSIPCSSLLCTYPSGIHTDTMRAFRLELDSLMPWKVPRKAYTLGSKRNRRLAQIEAMKKLYQDGGNHLFKTTTRTSIHRDEDGMKEETNNDEPGIIEWLDTLQIL